MAAGKHVVSLLSDSPSAAKGSDSGGDPHHAQSDWIIAENATFPTRHAIAKRYGFTRSQQAYDAKTLFPAPGGPLLLGGTDAQSYDPDTDTAHDLGDGLGSFRESLHITACDVEPFGSYTVDVGDDVAVESHDGGTWVALTRWIEGTGLLLEVFDKGSGALLDSTDLGTGSPTTDPARARFCIVDGASQVYCVNATGVHIRTIDTAGSIGAVASLSTAVSSSEYAYMDACAVGDGAAVLYSTGAEWRCTFFPLGALLGASSYTAHTTALATCCSIWDDGEGGLALAYAYKSGATHYLDYKAVTVPFFTVEAAGALHSVVTADYDIAAVSGVRITGFGHRYSKLYATIEDLVDSTGHDPCNVARLSVTDSGGVITASAVQTAYNCRLWARPVENQTGNGCLVGLYSQTWHGLAPDSFTGKEYVGSGVYNQASLYLANTECDAIGRALGGLARTDKYWPVGIGSTGYQAAASRVSASITGSSVLESRDAVAVSFDVAAADLVSFVAHAGATYVGGSCPIAVSGPDVTQHGFLGYPDPLSTEIVVGGGALAAGVYRFRAVLEEFDARGHLLRSTPTTTECAVTVADLDAVYVSMRALGVDTKAASARFVVYRTTCNGTTYYRDQSAELPGTAGVVTVLSMSADSSLYAGAVIADNEVLYTDGGALENQPPPPYLASCIHKNRMFVVPSEYAETEVRHSQALDDHEVPSFHESLALRLPYEGGRVVALASDGGVLYALKEHGAYAIEGDPGAADGLSATWSAPFEVRMAPGCASLRSVVSATTGVMYAGVDGAVWLLSGASAQPIGDRQRYHIDAHGPIICAAVLPSESLVVFAMAATGAPLLVYNYLHDKWAQWTCRSTTLAVCVVDEVLYRLDDSGYIWRYAADTYGDNDGTTDNWQGLRLRSGFVHKTATPDGWQRISEVIASGYKHGSDGFDLKIACAYNGEPSFESKVRDTSAIVGFDPSAAYGAGSSTYEGEGFTMRFQPSARKQGCSSIMVEISDEEGDDGPQQGFTLTSASLLVQPATGTRRSGRTRNVKD